MKILLIEDVPEFSEPAADELQVRGHTVDVIDNADEVLAAFSRINSYDLVILDLMMMRGKTIPPDEESETGIALLKRIRAKFKRLPVLLLTAIPKRDVWDAMKDDPMVKYWEKPLPASRNMERFFELVEQWPTK